MEFINNIKIPGALKRDIIINKLKNILEKKKYLKIILLRNVLDEIQILIDNNLIVSFINIIFDATKGKFSIGNKSQCEIFKCFKK